MALDSGGTSSSTITRFVGPETKWLCNRRQTLIFFNKMRGFGGLMQLVFWNSDNSYLHNVSFATKDEQERFPGVKCSEVL